MRLGWVTVAAAALCVALAGPAAAQFPQPPADGSPGRAGDPGGFHQPAAAVEHRPAVASFEGSQLDLAVDWGAARACLVWRDQVGIECYRTPAEVEARAGQLTATTALATASCASPLRLFQDSAYGGRELWFFDRGYWQNLADYGFDDQLSSYIVGACYSHLAEYADGAGWWYPGSTSPFSYVPYMSSSWNDRVSSIEID